jgi:formylglycine-generating enzyme required for sulfatase activity
LYQNPATAVETQANRADSDCMSQSQGNVTPWRFISREDAAVFCARAGKRLPTATEWYQAALGTPDGSCNLTSNVLFPTGKQLSCVSAVGMRDAVGNVWEWTRDDVIDGGYNDRALPNAGYVREVDAGGMATETQLETPESTFYNDYIWSNQSGVYGLLRGGFYGSGDDGGVFAVQAMTKPSFTGAAIGFRCVQ